MTRDQKWNCRSPEARARRALRKKERQKQLRGADGVPDTSDIPEVNESWFKSARLVKPTDSNHGDK